MVFLEQLDLFTATVTALSDADLVAASHCRGWTTGDVVVHVHMGLQEMLLGLVSPADEPPDTDAVTYWRAAPPATDDEADGLDGLRFVRSVGAAYRRPSNAVRHLLPTVDGIRCAVRAFPAGSVRFQGHVLPIGDFLQTWTVELAIHHLDLTRELSLAPPSADALRLTRSTIEALAGFTLPASWDDRTVALLGAGRVRPDAAQSAVLAGRFPVLG
jgi:hypothetical protein